MGIFLFTADTATDSSPFSLVETGTYRLTIDGFGNTTGEFLFQLLDFGAAESITFGEIVTSDLNVPAPTSDPRLEADFYQFEGQEDKPYF